MSRAPSDDAGTPELLTIAAAARLLGCSEGSIYAHLGAGRLPSERVADERNGSRRTRRLIPRAALEQFQAADRKTGWRRRIRDEELRQAIRYLREGLDSEAAGERVGLTGRAIRKRLEALGFRESDLRPAPEAPPALDREELRRRRLTYDRQRVWERDHAREPGRWTWTTRAEARRRDVHVMLTETAAAELRAEAERRRVSLSSLVAAALYDAGIITEA